MYYGGYKNGSDTYDNYSTKPGGKQKPERILVQFLLHMLVSLEGSLC